MSTFTDNFENSIMSFAQSQKGKPLPNPLPAWITALGISSTDTITDAKRVGASGSKTDVTVYFTNNKELNISIKMASADYFGNWYSHSRIMAEFGQIIFDKLTRDCTNWANQWLQKTSSNFFVGVSISFGKRVGGTGSRFLDVFTLADIQTIVAGSGGAGTANCLYTGSVAPTSLSNFFTILQPINSSTIFTLSQDFKIIYRPINPLTERSNRSKCSYTQFVPSQRLNKLTEVKTLADLRPLGQFERVTANSMNHNRIIKKLKADFNVQVPIKR